MQDNLNPLVGFAQLLERIARQLPDPPWAAQELQERRPLFKGIREKLAPKPAEPQKPKAAERGTL